MSKYVIAIPSYNRSTSINSNTIRVLMDGNIDLTNVFVFVANRTEYDLYQPILNSKIHLIIGEPGIMQQRNFISNYFKTDTVIVSMDDDIQDIQFVEGSQYTSLNLLLDFLTPQCNGLIGMPSCANHFFVAGKPEFAYGLYFAVGCMHIYKNRKYQLQTSYIEDYERTCQYYVADGGVVRYNWLIFKTKYWNKIGGIASSRTLDTYYTNVAKLAYLYPDYISYKLKIIKELGGQIYNPKLIYRPLAVPIQTLPELRAGFFDELYRLLSTHSVSTVSNKNRMGFPHHRAECYGLSKPRICGSIGLSACSMRYPEIWEEILRIGDIICPFQWTSCHLNNNVICPPHKDSRNVGDSVLVSFGEYTGCNIVIDGIVMDARHRPIIFNGSNLEHWNTPDLIGNKYSLVYYISNF